MSVFPFTTRSKSARTLKPSYRRRPQVEMLEVREVLSTIFVGSGAGKVTFNQAAFAANAGDTVLVDPGTYTNFDVKWVANNLTIKANGGSVTLSEDPGYALSNLKGIFDIIGNNYTVQGITFQGAHDLINPDHNWAGIRLEGDGLTVDHCTFQGNDDGILGGAIGGHEGLGDIVFKYSVFVNNGYNDGNGLAHNMYIGHVHSFTLEYCDSRDSNTGHEVKSRALNNYILYNFIGEQTDGSNDENTLLNLPDGGQSYVIGNVFRKGPSAHNTILFDYNTEGAGSALYPTGQENQDQNLYFVNNTMINDKDRGAYLVAHGSTTSVNLINNLFAGSGAVVTPVYTGQDGASPTPATDSKNKVIAAPGFVDAANFNYHLKGSSAAVDAGIDPGSAPVPRMAGVFYNLTPTNEYVPEASTQPRSTNGPLDVGAYELPGVAPTPQTITFNPLAAVTYGTAPLTLTATGGGSGNPIIFSIVSGPGTISGSRLTVTGAGSIVIEADQAGNATFSAAAPVTQTLVVNRAALTITPSANQSKTYGAGLPTLTYSARGFVNGEGVGVLSGLLGTNATLTSSVGIYAFTLGTLTTSNYQLSLVASPPTFAVTRAALTVTTNDASGTVGAPLPTFTASYNGFVLSENSSVLGGSLVFTTSATAASPAGTYLVTPSGLTSANYTLTFKPGTLTIAAPAPTPQTITFNPLAALTYGTAPLTVSATGGGSGNPVIFTILSGPGKISGSTLTVTGAGSIVVEADQAGNASFTAAAPVTQTLVVNPATLTYAATAVSRLYGAGNPTLSGTVTGFVTGDTQATATTGTVTFTTLATASSNVGSYASTGSGLTANNGNYVFAQAAGNATAVSITPAPLTVTAANQTGTAGQPFPSFTFSVTGLVNGDLQSVVSGVTLTTPATSGSPAGTYPITVTGGAAANYSITRVNGTLTLTAPVPPVNSGIFAVGSGSGEPSLVKVYSAAGVLQATFTAFDPGFQGGVTVAVADVNGDGTLDVIVGAGPGGAPHVKVIDGGKLNQLQTNGVIADTALLANFYAFGMSFTGGVFVAGGHFSSGPSSQVVTGAGPGGGPHVRTWSISGGAATQLAGPLGSFFAFGSGFHGGVNLAAADLEGTGLDDLITGAGPGGGPHVKAFRTDRSVYANFFAYENSFTGGVFVAAGQLDGSGKASIVTGPGTGHEPRVNVYGGSPVGLLTSFDAYAPYQEPGTTFLGGVRVAVEPLGAFGTTLRPGIVTGAGPGGASHVRGFDGRTFTELDSFFAFDSSFSGGVFVG